MRPGLTCGLPVISHYSQLDCDKLNIQTKVADLVCDLSAGDVISSGSAPVEH